MPSDAPSDDTVTAVRRIIADALHRPFDEVTAETALDGAGLGLDSLALIQLQVSLEERFDVTLPDLLDDELARVRLVRDVADLVTARLAAERAA